MMQERGERRDTEESEKLTAQSGREFFQLRGGGGRREEGEA